VEEMAYYRIVQVSTTFPHKGFALFSRVEEQYPISYKGFPGVVHVWGF